MLTVGRGAGMPASRALKSGGQRGGAATKSGAQQANFPSVHRSWDIASRKVLQSFEI